MTTIFPEPEAWVASITRDGVTWCDVIHSDGSRRIIPDRAYSLRTGLLSFEPRAGESLVDAVARWES